MRRLRVFLLNAFLLLIPLLAGAWLLTVQPAHAQYPGSNYPGGDYPGSDTGYSINTGWIGTGTVVTPTNNTGGDTGYPGTTGGNTGYPGTTGGNTGYPGNTGSVGNTGGDDTGGAGTGGGTGGPITPGHWDVTYSSQGTSSWHYPASYMTVMSGTLPWPATESGSEVGSNYYLDASTTGTVTGTLKWVPTTGQDSTTDPPSSAVIVTEIGYAAASGYGSGTATADDGWGDKPGGGGSPGDASGGGGSPGDSSGGGGSPGDPSSAYSSGTHYEVKDGSSGTITVGPFTLSADTPDNTTPDADGGFSAMGASVSASIYFFPNSVTIGLDGVNAANQALTGQQVKAHLDGAPANVSSYTWSFTGGTPIKNWDPSSTSNDKTIPLAPSDLSATDPTGNGIPVAPIGFYYTKTGSVTVTCTAKFTAPNGQPATVTVNSSPITYLKPTVKWLLTNFNPNFGHLKGFFTDPPNQQYGAEEPWGPINITVPDPFTGGHGYIAQIATLSRSYTRYNPQPNMPDTSYKRVSVLYNDGTQGAVDTPTGLDVGYPYPYGYTKGGPAAKPIFTLVKSKYTWEAGSTGYSDDQPFQYYTTTDVDLGGSFWHASGANDSFDTWVMYQPPSAGGGTIYVPLMKLTWKWGGFASRSFTSSSGWSAWTSGEGTPFTEGSPAITDAYPSWPLSIPSGFSVGP